MKHSLLILAFVAIALTSAFGQAQKPKIMVRPGKAWCEANGYYKTEDNQGRTVKVYDYDGALNDMKMKSSIVDIEAILKDEGFETVSMSSQTEAIDEFAAEEMLMDDEYGNGIEKSQLDVMREKATADIYLDISWSIETVGPKKQLSYILEGKDYYTGDDVCSVTGLGEPSISATEATLLKEAVIGKIPEMKDRLCNYMTDILEKGRRVYVAIRKSNASDVHLETFVEGGTLDDVISDWLAINAVQHRSSKIRSSRTSANYTVNIPLYRSNGLQMTTEDFLKLLRNYLAASPYNIKSRVTQQGLGRATLTIDGKQ